LKIIKISDLNIIYYILYVLSILFYFFILLIDASSDWKAKWIIDLKFVSSSKLFLCYGTLGIIIYSIICTITTLKGYDTLNNNDNYFFKFDNFVIYFNELTKTNCILMILYAITFALESFFYILIIERLTPFHIISLPTFYKFLIQIFLAINTIIRNEKLFKNNMVYIILELMAYFFGLIAFSIFLEFIELNFCLCNYNLRRYIVQRSNNEIYNNRNDSILSEEYKKEEDESKN